MHEMEWNVLFIFHCKTIYSIDWQRLVRQGQDKTFESSFKHISNMFAHRTFTNCRHNYIKHNTFILTIYSWWAMLNCNNHATVSHTLYIVFQCQFKNKFWQIMCFISFWYVMYIDTHLDQRIPSKLCVKYVTCVYQHFNLPLLRFINICDILIDTSNIIFCQLRGCSHFTIRNCQVDVTYVQRILLFCT